ncbi:CRISPR-associated helicase Cas3' [Fuchsiella alkaliacetigena]|uniref:CRISPR-associated helicase Cas3' n=1 Tax=Fuchsiella alkaliacetigena TaxID=957042 RepID=UPI00200A9FC2|nr:CRISPR-associated helicase Cas3' [Fuchsiella alkaliacetigena]MCK8823997.1 CRISPR-associated helicase Cas3' [Fuchsiella alkaliacetigena]
MAYIAHSENNQGEFHLLKDHLHKTAKMVEKFTSKWNAGDLGYALGLIHDIGKYSDDFQDYLLNDDKKSAEHKYLGTMIVFNHFQLLSFIVAGHHGGLHNFVDLKNISKDYKNILDKKKEVIKRFENEIDKLQNIDFNLPKKQFEDDKLKYEFFLRMMYSALVDADFLDTESHFDPNKANLRPQKSISIKKLWGLFKKDQLQLINSAENTKVNRIRDDIYRQVIAKSNEDEGFFSMTVPTGGGKTRTGLGFALKHGALNNMDRIIVVIPYTNIIEQTAKEYKEILGKDNVIEHHSSIEIEDDSEKHRLAAENWDLPIVVTTSVQFFESLFAYKPSRCRKLHNLANSVIIFDEVQTLPPELLEPIIWVLKELVNQYSCSIVFSTATQPAFQKRSGFNGIESIEELVDNPPELFSKMSRVEYCAEQFVEIMNWQQVAGIMLEEKQSLVVVNTKDQAAELYQELINSTSEDKVFHLSNSMCAVHRKDILDKVRDRLKLGQACYLVSTQLIEAGVDIDFPLVLRAISPLDSIVQAAGRCNREGKLDKGRVIIFEPEENVLPKGIYKTATARTDSFLKELNKTDKSDLFKRYFNSLYRDIDLDSKNINKERESFNYREVARSFKIIPDDSFNVIIENYQEIEGYNPAVIRKKGFISREEWRLLQPYTVSLKKYRLNEYLKEGYISELIEGVYIWGAKYDQDLGIKVDNYEADSLTV